VSDGDAAASAGDDDVSSLDRLSLIVNGLTSSAPSLIQPPRSLPPSTTGSGQPAQTTLHGQH